MAEYVFDMIMFASPRSTFVKCGKGKGWNTKEN